MVSRSSRNAVRLGPSPGSTTSFSGAIQSHSSLLLASQKASAVWWFSRTDWSLYLRREEGHKHLQGGA